MFITFEEHGISVPFFKVDMSNVTQRRYSVAIFNLEFRNVQQRQNKTLLL